MNCRIKCLPSAPGPRRPLICARPLCVWRSAERPLFDEVRGRMARRAVSGKSGSFGQCLKCPAGHWRGALLRPDSTAAAGDARTRRPPAGSCGWTSWAPCVPGASAASVRFDKPPMDPKASACKEKSTGNAESTPDVCRSIRQLRVRETEMPAMLCFAPLSIASSSKSTRNRLKRNLGIRHTAPANFKLPRQHWWTTCAAT